MQFQRICTIEHEIEAQLLDSVLTDMGIVHRLRSYHDIAYDGLFQASLGWGEVYAAEGDKETILSVLTDIRHSDG